MPIKAQKKNEEADVDTNALSNETKDSKLIITDVEKFKTDGGEHQITVSKFTDVIHTMNV